MRLSCPAAAEKNLAVCSLKLGQYARVNECSLEKLGAKLLVSIRHNR